MVKILCIAVHYGSPSVTCRFLDQLLSQRGSFSLEVLIVDNSTNGGDDLGRVSIAPNVRCLRPGGNLGYYGAAKWALDWYLSAGGCVPEWVIVSNTDIEFQGDDFLSQLADLPCELAAAVLAPAIISSANGGDQNPFMRHRPSAYRMHFYKWVFKVPLLYTWYDSMSRLKKRLRGRLSPPAADLLAPANVAPIYAPHGSFVIFPGIYFQKGGNLAHGAFLFGEEIFVAEAARRVGIRVVYYPKLRVLHREHSSTGQMPWRLRAAYAAEAAAYCADTFFRW